MFRIGVDLDTLSFVSHYLRMIPAGVDIVLATGTGFIYEFEGNNYLITNGHNVTRLDPNNNRRLINSIAFPSKIRTKFRVYLNETEPIAIETRLFDIPLYSDDDNLVPNWFIHPSLGYVIDVVAIKLPELPVEFKVFAINQHGALINNEILANPSDDVFIIGYPLDMSGGKELPIWKRGTIATEPGIDLDDLPKILVDTATRSGMSGSPVIFQRTGLHNFNINEPESMGKAIIGTVRSFLGIYSGRIGADDNFQAQLGIVWKKTVIDEILQAKQIGTIDFQNI